MDEGDHITFYSLVRDYKHDSREYRRFIACLQTRMTEKGIKFVLSCINTTEFIYTTYLYFLSAEVA